MYIDFEFKLTSSIDTKDYSSEFVVFKCNTGKALEFAKKYFNNDKLVMYHMYLLNKEQYDNFHKEIISNNSFINMIA